MSVLQQSLILLMRVYRLTISPTQAILFGEACGCRYTPTCSQYALDALRLHGGIRGSVLTVKRLCRCHPWGGCGHDPVPGAGAEDRSAGFSPLQRDKGEDHGAGWQRVFQFGRRSGVNAAPRGLNGSGHASGSMSARTFGTPADCQADDRQQAICRGLGSSLRHGEVAMRETSAPNTLTLIAGAQRL